MPQQSHERDLTDFLRDEDPDIFGNCQETTQDAIQQLNGDVELLTDEQFFTRYKVTKQQCQVLLASMTQLQALNTMLEAAAGDMDIDGDISDTVEVLMDDLGQLIDKMLNASYWVDEV